MNLEKQIHKIKSKTQNISWCGGTGRHGRLKIYWPMPMWVRLPPSALWRNRIVRQFRKTVNLLPKGFGGSNPPSSIRFASVAQLVEQ